MVYQFIRIRISDTFINIVPENNYCKLKIIIIRKKERKT